MFVCGLRSKMHHAFKQLSGATTPYMLVVESPTSHEITSHFNCLFFFITINWQKTQLHQLFAHGSSLAAVVSQCGVETSLNSGVTTIRALPKSLSRTN